MIKVIRYFHFANYYLGIIIVIHVNYLLIAFYNSYQPKQFLKFDLAIIKLQNGYHKFLGPKSDYQINPICLNFTTPNDEEEFSKESWTYKRLTMIGMGKNGTETNEILNFANVYPLPIEECIQKMYNFKNPWTNSKDYSHDNAICIHGKKCV